MSNPKADSTRMTIDSVNHHLGENIEAMFDWLEIDFDDFSVYGEGLRGPSCCHGGDNPTGFSYYEDKNCWFCWTSGCHVENGADLIGLVASVKGVERKKAIPISRQFVEKMIESGEFERLANIEKVERVKEDYCKAHLEQNTFPVEILDKLGKDLHYATKRGFDQNVLNHMGCGVSRYGRMEGRFTFPVKNIVGDIVGFSGRDIFNDENVPKWMHSTFRRSVNLLNIDLCKKAMDTWSLDTVVISEGPWDVARLCQAGFWNSMALLGASLSKGQLDIMKSMGVSKVILFMDNDEGGRNHEGQNVQKLNSCAFDVEVVYPPKEGQDVGDMEIEDIKRILRSLK
jgi:5S rRNA maturation endonuclease (ribonuclease M5)